MSDKKLSIIIPVCNEKDTIERILVSVQSSPLPPGMGREVIIIDDGSTDGSRQIIEKLAGEYRVIIKKRNEGKGAAIRDGLKAASGDYTIIQDADLEYNPMEYSLLLQPLLVGQADAVYGSRFLRPLARAGFIFRFYWANQLITCLFNLCAGTHLSDVETCYKCFNRRVQTDLIKYLSANRFGIELEITALITRRRYRLKEIGISYYGRNCAAGKKIGWKDGLAALWFIFYYNFIRRYS